MSMLKSYDDWTRFLVRWLGIALALHVVAIFFSQGFFHSDEHFQILEFLNWKLGRSPVSALPIEFHEAMRPWLEPGIFYLMTHVMLLLGIHDPFAWALSFRAVSGFFGWLSIVGLALCSRYWFQDMAYRKASVIALCLIWYLPALHARPSSENWGGSAFILGLCLFLLTRVYQNRGSPWLWGGLSGLLFGLAFEFRYQTAFMVIGAFAWLWFRAHISRKDSTALIVGVLAACAIGTGADAWGYGHWVIAPWNYVDFNLIRGMVSSVDTDPWWDLFRRAFTESWPLLGFLLLVSLPVAWVFERRHVLTWSYFPFFLVHAVIGHKELRFLFPMAHAAPVLAVLAAEHLVPKTPRWVRYPAALLGGWDLLGLMVLTVIPAWMPIRFLDFMWHAKARYSKEIVLHWKEKNPYEISGIAMNFYRPEGIRTERIESYSQIVPELKAYKTYWLFYDGFEFSGDAAGLAPYCHPVFKALPAWVESVTGKVGASRWLRHVTDWSLYACRR